MRASARSELPLPHHLHRHMAPAIQMRNLETMRLKQRIERRFRMNRDMPITRRDIPVVHSQMAHFIRSAGTKEKHPAIFLP